MTGHWLSLISAAIVSTSVSATWMADGRAALILMDYPNRRRLKIYARVEKVKDISIDR